MDLATFFNMNGKCFGVMIFSNVATLEFLEFPNDLVFTILKSWLVNLPLPNVPPQK